jgi:hypothetical protein
MRGRPTLGRRLEQAGVQAQPSDDTEPVPDSVEQVDDGVAAIGDRDNAAVRQPARDLEQSLPCPVGQLLMAASVFLRVPLGGREHGQERQRPDAPGPGDRRQQHDREPSQPARLDEVAVAGAHRIPINPARFDLRAPAPFQRVIEADNHWPLWGEGLHQQEQQALSYVPR